MRHVIVFAVVLLAAPHPAGAEDTAAVMAALKDEAAECRYLATLHKRLTDALDRHDLRASERAGEELGAASDVVMARHPHPAACFNLKDR